MASDWPLHSFIGPEDNKLVIHYLDSGGYIFAEIQDADDKRLGHFQMSGKEAIAIATVLLNYAKTYNDQEALLKGKAVTN
tara:strand:- start:159 stop:398 length:240 start_codon:yes stop_codon:yes gene_type:complete